jgi:hypothetical protein
LRGLELGGLVVGKGPFGDLADRRPFPRRGRPRVVRRRQDRLEEKLTKSVNTGSAWRTFHHVLVWGFAGGWLGWLVVFAVFPETRTIASRGVLVGTGALLPHIWMGRSIWHKEGRTGIGIPIAILIARFAGSLILMAIFIWLFPAENRIIAWTVGTLIIVFTAVESFLFCKGVERL